MTKLRMQFTAEVKAPLNEAMAALRDKVNAVMEAALAINIFMTEQKLIKA